MSNNVEVEITPIEVSTPSSGAVTGMGDVPICVEKNQEVTVQKKEYSIVGDALYATVSTDEAPEWLTSIIDSLIDLQIASSLADLDDLRASIILSLSELEVAKNQYEELINIEETIDRIITSRLTTLNASMDQANANIITLQLTTVTPTQAAAIAATQITSSLNDGAIKSAINEVSTTISSLDESVANMYLSLVSAIEGVGEATSEVEVLANVLKDRLEASWSYNAKLLLSDGRWYRSGFGLNTSVQTDGDGSEGNPYLSEFWINAQRFKFTNTTMSGTVTPFTIDASGATPAITFTGNVVINNRENAVTGGIPVFLGSFSSAPSASVSGDTYRNTVDGIVYTWDGTTWVSTQGPEGIDGDDGARGPGFFRIGTTTGVWSDSVANSALPDGIPVKDDTVTIYQTTNVTVATTKMYNGTAWVAPALAVHGNMVVDGTISGQKLIIGTIQGQHIQNGSSSDGITAVKFTDWLLSDLQPNGTPTTGFANAALALNFRTGDAYLRNIYARGDIEASSMKAGSIFVGGTIQSTNFNPANPYDAGWRISADGSAIFNGLVITRPNAIISGNITMGSVGTSWASSHFYTAAGSGHWSSNGNGTLINLYTLPDEFGPGDALRHLEFTYDVPSSSYPNSNVWTTTGPLLGVSCVITSADWYYSGSDPGGPYGQVTCHGTVERVGDLVSNSFLRVRITVPLPDILKPSVRGVQIRNIYWSILAIT